MLSLLENATSLESISLGISQMCVLNTLPDPSTPPDESSIVSHPSSDPSTLSAMRTFTYVAEYGTNYLLEFPQFKEIILARTGRLTNLYLRVDYRSSGYSARNSKWHVDLFGNLGCTL